MRANKDLAEYAAKLVADWNKKHKPGTPVVLTKDDGKKTKTITVSEAEVLGGYTAVIWVKGLSGCYDLERVRPDGQE